MEFFPEPPVQADEPEPQPRSVWAGPPEDVLPGVVPVELFLGRSTTAVVFLTGMRAFPTGLAMTLGVRVRGSHGPPNLNDEMFDSFHPRLRDAAWRTGRLKWGFELADGRRVTNVDPPAWSEQPNQGHDRPHQPEDWQWEPDHPVLQGGGGSGGRRSVNRDYWLWPLPPAGRLRLVCQWLDHDIAQSVQDLQMQPLMEAAARARPVWPVT